MTSLSAYCRLRFARTLVLLALLVTCGLQVQELGHGHAAGNGQAECLLCQGTLDTPLAIVVSGPLPLQRDTALPVWYRAIPPVLATSPVLARGPPSDS